MWHILLGYRVLSPYRCITARIRECFLCSKMELRICHSIYIYKQHFTVFICFCTSIQSAWVRDPHQFFDYTQVHFEVADCPSALARGVCVRVATLFLGHESTPQGNIHMNTCPHATSLIRTILYELSSVRLVNLLTIHISELQTECTPTFFQQCIEMRGPYRHSECH